MDTSMGLSSIATLSLGLSMSMAGAGRAVMRSLGPGHRQALQQFFPVIAVFPVIPDAAFAATAGASPRQRPHMDAAQPVPTEGRMTSCWLTGWSSAVSTEGMNNEAVGSEGAQSASELDETSPSVNHTEDGRTAALLKSPDTTQQVTAQQVTANGVGPSRSPQDNCALPPRLHVEQIAKPSGRPVYCRVVEQLNTLVPDVVIHAADSRPVPGGKPCVIRRQWSNDVTYNDVTPLVQSVDSVDRLPSSSTTSLLKMARNFPAGGASSSLPQLSLSNGGGTGSGASSHCSGVGQLRHFDCQTGSNNWSLGALHHVEGATSGDVTAANLVRSRATCRPCHDLSKAVDRPSPRYTLQHFRSSSTTSGGSAESTQTPEVVLIDRRQPANNDRATLLKHIVCEPTSSPKPTVSASGDVINGNDQQPTVVGGRTDVVGDVKSVVCPLEADGLAVRGGTRGGLAVVGSKAWWSKSDETTQSTEQWPETEASRRRSAQDQLVCFSLADVTLISSGQTIPEITLVQPSAVEKPTDEQRRMPSPSTLESN